MKRLGDPESEHLAEARFLADKAHGVLHKAFSYYGHGDGGCGYIVPLAVEAYSLAREARREISYSPRITRTKLRRDVDAVVERSSALLQRAFNSCVVRGGPR